MRKASAASPRRTSAAFDPQAPREWVGGRFRFFGWIEEPEPHRPYIDLWLELPSDLLVRVDLLDPKAPIGFAASFAEAMRRPAAGPPRRPSRVRVADEDLAAEVAEYARQASGSIEVVVAPTPELDAVLEMMERTLPSGGVDPTYLPKGEDSEKIVRELFDAARALWAVAPWKDANDAPLIRVDIPEYDVEGACLSVIGALGQSHGFLLFPSLEGYEEYADAAARAERNRRRGVSEESWPHTSFIAFTFEREAALPHSMLAEAVAHRWPTASSGLYPLVMPCGDDGAPRPLTEEDLLHVTAIIRSLGAMCIKHPRLLASDLDEPLCESWCDGDDLEVRFTTPYEAWPLFEVNRDGARGHEPPRELAAAMVREYKKRHYAGWIDEKLPALGGKTPRQASRSKVGRRQLDRVLRQMETLEAGLPEDERFDFSPIRAQLERGPKAKSR